MPAPSAYLNRPRRSLKDARLNLAERRLQFLVAAIKAENAGNWPVVADLDRELAAIERRLAILDAEERGR